MDHLKTLQRQLRDGKIGRRRFMQGALALGFSATAASSLADKVLAAPNKGGHLRVGKAHGQTTDSLDPVSWENGFMLQMGYAVQDYLTEIDNTGQLVPRLAESWEASDDAVSWTFKIKQGAEFHDGKTVEADDVIASINEHRGEDTEFHNGKTVEAADVIASINEHRGEDSKSPAKPIVDPIVEIKADDASTVTFVLNGGNADFPFLMSDYHL
nr:hypothetical protein [Desulfuromonadales bacterium]